MAKKTKKQAKVKFNTEFWQKLVSNRTSHLVVGLSLIGLSLFSFLAFISYYYNWTSDQSLVQQGFGTMITQPEVKAENLLGKLGAALGHQLIFLGFGLGAFLWSWLAFVIGLRLSLALKVFSLKKAIASSLFFMLWIPTLLAYFFPDYGQLAGSTGYWLENWSNSLMGPVGTIVVLIFLLFSFLAIRFQLTSDKILSAIKAWREMLQGKAEELKSEIKEAGEVTPPPISEASQDLEPESEEGEASFELEIESQAELKEQEPVLETEIPLEVDIPEESPSEKAPSEADETEFEVQEVEEEDELSEKEIKRKLKEFGEYDPTLDLSRFKLPPIDLLKNYGSHSITRNDEELEANKNRIIETLKNYKIDIAKIQATIGPTVTLYEIVPAPGVRISKIKNLEDDIALSLSALGIRIIAPIPGRGTIGIEVPSTTPQMVPMRNLIAGEKYQQAQMELPIAFGKTISNETFITDLAKMPHLLMAGATGQGKSVGLNVILTSLLYKKHPSQVKFVLVDPKKVELTLFNHIERHYLAKLPDTEDAIITDTTKVINTLNSLCIEMDNRYDLLKNAMVRNIKEYNAKFIQRRLNPEEGHRYLPYIVLVIDEFADLIMTAGKEVETPIARLAQLARAIGIHLIVATQRPSVNVITGIIKANFPARVAFRVSSKIDSRTILDAGGAEQLIGKGDMLMSLGGSDLIRLQCAFVDTPEVEKVTDYIGSQQAYPMAYQLPEYSGADEDGGSSLEIDPSDRDKLFEEAARLVVQSQQGSASMLQRKLKLGYNRAGRIVDQLEAAGIIGPFEGSKAREVLIPDEYSLEQLLNKEKE